MPTSIPPLKARINALLSELSALERQAEAATCAEIGHKPRLAGGRNAGCDEHCCCSVPVYECERCGECDYGYNNDADAVREQCRETNRTMRGGPHH